MRTRDSLPEAKYCKNCLRGYTPFGQIYTKNYQISAILGAVSPHFKSDNSQIWHEGADLGVPPRSQNLFFLNRLRGIPFGQIYT